MTLEEKAGMCSGDTAWTTKAIEHLGIPSIVLTDGPNGVRLANPKAGIDALNRSLPATCFPTAPALAATWDVDLIRQVGVALGQEAQALGVQVLLGPGANMKRSPLGGRNFEYFSEDPVLAGRIAAAWIEGVQSQGVSASLKHFAANNQEFDRMVGDAIIDERTLHEIYLRAFEIAVREAQPGTVMCAYNKVNGTYASQNRMLLTDALRDDWGFQGLVVSDWGAVDDRVAGLIAGLDLEMPGSGGLNDRKLVAAVPAGKLDVKALDIAATRVVELALQTHAAIKTGATFDKDEHHALARKVAGQGAVLLKNNGVLPLAGDFSGRTAVIGRFARHTRYQGAGSSQVNPTRLDRPFDELSAALGGADRLVYAAGYGEEGDTSDALLAEAVAAAKAAQRAIVFVGLPDSYESEGFDRASMDLPAGHNALVSAIAAVQPNTVIVLMNGAPVAMPWIGEVPAVLEAYLGGQAGGGAIADVLTGKVNPSGKLAETFPKRLVDTPTYPNFPGRDGVALHGERLFIGYRYYDAKHIEPLFPFGFGLSYTRFAFESIKAASTEVGADGAATIAVTVRNTGSRAGAEVVQLYVHEQSSAVLRPEQELKAFAKVTLAPGESRVATFTLSSRDFAHYDPRTHTWVVDAGDYEVRVGGSSRDLPLHQVLHLAGTPPVHPKLTPYSSLGELEANPRGKPIYDQLVQGMLGRFAVTDQMTEDQAAAARKSRKTILGFINEMPLIKMVQVSQGRFSEQQMHEILQEVNQP